MTHGDCIFICSDEQQASIDKQLVATRSKCMMLRLFLVSSPKSLMIHFMMSVLNAAKNRHGNHEEKMR